MIVVSDTGPINYLLRLEIIGIVPYLYGSVMLPETVRQEMLHPNAPDIVRAWALQPPEWIVVRQPKSLLPLELDAGELAAISLAVEMNAERMLMDDRKGRSSAQAYQLPVVGTLGILANAAQIGLVDFDDAIEKLKNLGFYVSPAAIETLRISEKTQIAHETKQGS